MLTKEQVKKLIDMWQEDADNCLVAIGDVADGTERMLLEVRYEVRRFTLLQVQLDLMKEAFKLTEDKS